jgi:hypothetical protein
MDQTREPAHRQPDGERPKKKPGLRLYALVTGWLLVTACTVAVATAGLHAALTRGGGKADQAEPQAGVESPPGSPPPATSPPLSPSPTATPTPTPTPSGHAGKPPPPRPVPRPKPRAHLAGPPRVHITSPKRYARITGRQGVLVSGTATRLGRNVLRLVDHAPDGMYYLVDNGPIPVRGGRWSYHDPVVGDGERDVGKTFVMTIVLANPRCQGVLQAVLPSSDGNIRMARLPRDCSVAAQAPVHKIAP